MNNIDPELFIYELYESNYIDRLGLSYDVNPSILNKKILECAIGYCDASRLYVRPRSDMIAVMCEDENHEKFWFHHFNDLLITSKN